MHIALVYSKAFSNWNCAHTIFQETSWLDFGYNINKESSTKTENCEQVGGDHSKISILSELSQQNLYYDTLQYQQDKENSFIGQNVCVREQKNTEYSNISNLLWN